jgi:hypothetical protein
VKVFACERSGVPEITPADESDSPSGSAPDSSVHVYGGSPPAARRVVEYLDPIFPFGSDAVDTSSGLTVSVTFVVL